MTDEQLSALLRLKRYEQPAPQYFDRLLQDIHRRQRAELLRRPLWKIAAERVQTFFSEHSMGHLSYAGALAAVLVVGLTGIGFLTSGGSMDRASRQVQLAFNTSDKPNTPVDPPAPEKPMLSLAAGKPVHVLDASLPAAQTSYGSGYHQPRYIIDTRPVSYDPSSAFKGL
jgi:hypothetical protein